MDWNNIVSAMPKLIKHVRESYTLDNAVIRDDIFKILEQHCIVIYYPLEDEDSGGFHIKRFVDGKLADFVYINTAKEIPKQVFTAAHELGHVWKVRDKLSYIINENIPVEYEEDVVNRFAAELLMPEVEFKKTFNQHFATLNIDNRGITISEMIRIMVMQMNDYMVPYESVRRRMVELDIIKDEAAELLINEKGKVSLLIKAFSSDINTMLDSVTKKKTIPGLRDLIEQAESKDDKNDFIIQRLKEDFEINDIEVDNTIINLEE